METIIDAMQPDDWPQIRAIYLEGIATGCATFETGAPEWSAWDAAHCPFARLVARNGDTILGWAALAPVSARPVYAGVAENSVYVAAVARGEGVGRLLLTRLIEEAERGGIWTLQAGIFPENVASVKLHECCGFRVVGVRERVGKLYGVWHDNVLMERRSEIVGSD